MVFIAKIRYTWFILLCKKITLNQFVVRLQNATYIIMSVRPITYFYGNMFGTERSDFWSINCSHFRGQPVEDMAGWLSIYLGKSMDKTLWCSYWNEISLAEILQGAIIFFLALNSCMFFSFGCPPSKVKVKYLYSATRCDAFTPYVVRNIFLIQASLKYLGASSDVSIRSTQFGVAWRSFR